jgi:hypothetical protein
MQNTMSMEILAHDLIRSRLQEAAQDALADQLPHSSIFEPALAARQHLAYGLRALAGRLDPCMVSESSLAVANTR